MNSAVSCLREDFLIFRAHCERLEITLNMFEELYMGNERQNMLMSRLSPHFFVDLNNILHDQFMVQVYKLTDPPSTRAGQINLTFERIHQDMCACGLLNDTGILQEIDECLLTFKSFRSSVAKDARNRVCAHLDRNTLRELEKSGNTEAGIGAHKDHERVRFFDCMYRFVEIADHLLGLELSHIKDVGRLPGSSPREIFQWIEDRIE
jgi:hypothetical protein